MFVGILELDILFGDVHSLKAKRSLVRPLIAAITRRWSVAVAETGHQDLYRRCVVGVATISGDSAECMRILESVERMVAEQPHLELLAARHRLVGPDD